MEIPNVSETEQRTLNRIQVYKAGLDAVEDAVIRARRSIIVNGTLPEIEAGFASIQIALDEMQEAVMQVPHTRSLPATVHKRHRPSTDTKQVA